MTNKANLSIGFVVLIQHHMISSMFKPSRLKCTALKIGIEKIIMD